MESEKERKEINRKEQIVEKNKRKAKKINKTKKFELEENSQLLNKF
jgi:hypothetical protein